MAKKGLVVDDSRTTAMLLSKMLSAMDYETTICLSPREALQILLKTTPDVILLDVNMPGIDGLEVMRYIRRDPLSAKLPVIIISSDAATAEISKALVAGANVFLPKPVNFESLRLAVEDATKAKK
jgi:CheY-like chemotaxis protein